MKKIVLPGQEKIVQGILMKMVVWKMKILRGYKFRIYPNNQQENFINQNIEACRFIYNAMLADKINYYEKEKKFLQTTPAQYKDEFEWLKQMDI